MTDVYPPALLFTFGFAMLWIGLIGGNVPVVAGGVGLMAVTHATNAWFAEWWARIKYREMQREWFRFPRQSASRKSRWTGY